MVNLRSENLFIVNVFKYYFILIIFSDTDRYHEDACKRISLSIDFIEIKIPKKDYILYEKKLIISKISRMKS